MIRPTEDLMSSTVRRFVLAGVLAAAAVGLTACGGSPDAATPTTAAREFPTDSRISTSLGDCVKLTDHGVGMLLGDGQEPVGEWFAAGWSPDDPKELVVGGQVAGHESEGLALYTVWDASEDLSPTDFELELANTLNSVADSVSPGHDVEPARDRSSSYLLKTIYGDGIDRIQACRNPTENPPKPPADLSVQPNG
jgi:hypothetical protein